MKIKSLECTHTHVGSVEIFFVAVYAEQSRSSLLNPYSSERPTDREGERNSGGGGYGGVKDDQKEIAGGGSRCLLSLVFLYSAEELPR